MPSIKGPDRIPRHMEQTRFLRQLVVDLKLRELGETPPHPITMERLEEASTHLSEIERCSYSAEIMY